MKIMYQLNKKEDIKKMIKLESGIYSSTNNNGEDIVIMVEQNEGVVIYTNQKNGWIRFEEYNHLGVLEGQGFEGRWNK